MEKEVKYDGWRERIERYLRVHEDRIDQHGQAPRGRPKGAKIGWGLRDTARELRVPYGTLSEYLRLAATLRVDPEYVGSPTIRTALNEFRSKIGRKRG